LHGSLNEPCRKLYNAMFSIPDIMVISVLALLLFGPDRLPKIMRQAGRFMREVQNTSQSFVAEMERAADVEATPPAPPVEQSPPLADRHVAEAPDLGPDRGA
jgi:TatA/E family protein of Tat protein translocase